MSVLDTTSLKQRDLTNRKYFLQRAVEKKNTKIQQKEKLKCSPLFYFYCSQIYNSQCARSKGDLLVRVHKGVHALRLLRGQSINAP